MATTASSIAPWIAPTWVLISSFALLACPARLFTSVATTRNPLPVSPARTTSMVAFSANKFVYLAISLISSTNLPMSCADPERLSTLSFAPCVLCTVVLPRLLVRTKLGVHSMFAITPLYAGLLALIFALLSFRVIGMRRIAQIGLIDGGNLLLTR